jgi:hypothetical protein
MRAIATKNPPGPDPFGHLPGAVSGERGDIQFDDGNTFQASRCEASGPAGGRVYVEIEIYPKGDAHIVLHFGQYHLDPEKRYGLTEVKATELEPLTVALSQAVANAKARGFLPTTARGAAT